MTCSRNRLFDLFSNMALNIVVLSKIFDGCFSPDFRAAFVNFWGSQAALDISCPWATFGSRIWNTRPNSSAPGTPEAEGDSHRFFGGRKSMKSMKSMACLCAKITSEFFLKFEIWIETHLAPPIKKNTKKHITQKSSTKQWMWCVQGSLARLVIRLKSSIFTTLNLERRLRERLRRVFWRKIVKVLSGNAQNRNPGLDNKNVNRDHPSRFDSKLPFKHESSYPNTDNHPMYAWRYLANWDPKTPHTSLWFFFVIFFAHLLAAADHEAATVLIGCLNKKQRIPFEFSHRTVLHMTSGNLKHGFANHEAFSSSLQAQRLQAKHHKRDVSRTCKLIEKSATPK